MMSIIKGDILKYLISSSIFFIFHLVPLVASAGNDKKIDYATLVNSLETAKQYLEGLDSLITQEEFQKISTTKIAERNIISLHDIVYFVFLKKICSINPDSPFWTLGGELFYGINNEHIVFKNLVLDSSKTDSKPVIRVIPQDQSQDEKKLIFNDIKKIIFYIDNNIVLQDTVLKDFYEIENVFSIFDYDNNEALKHITGYVLGIKNDDITRANVYAQQMQKYNTSLSYYYLIFRHNHINNENVFKDAWGWMDADKHGYERHTQLLWGINFNKDYAALLYKLCSSPDFFNSLNEATVQNITVDFFNFFPELLYKKNESKFRQLLATRGLTDVRMAVNHVDEGRLRNYQEMKLISEKRSNTSQKQKIYGETQIKYNLTENKKNNNKDGCCCCPCC